MPEIDDREGEGEEEGETSRCFCFQKRLNADLTAKTKDHLFILNIKYYTLSLYSDTHSIINKTRGTTELVAAQDHSLHT